MFKQFAAAALAVSISTGALAEDFTAANFLTWDTKNQDGYITTSLAMTSAMAPSQGKCIDSWNTAARANGYEELVAIMRQHKQYHPTTVILAVIERACGTMTMAQH